MTLGTNPNYDVTKTDGTLTVNQAVATVTANAKSKFYGDGEPGADAVVAGAVGTATTLNYTPGDDGPDDCIVSRSRATPGGLVPGVGQF